MRDNIDLLARNVTENASRTGEHYIAEARSDLRGMFASSAGAGVIIGFMALIKILLSYLQRAPLIEALLFSMNYSLGFMLIHVLHFTIATKQPAMTAARIAAGLPTARRRQPAGRRRQHGGPGQQGVPHPDRGRAGQPGHRDAGRLADRHGAGH